MISFRSILIYFGGALSAAFLMWASPAIIGRSIELSREVQEGINAAKVGDAVRTRTILEKNIDQLNDAAISILIADYALGKGGDVDTAKAIALIRLTECKSFKAGETELYLAKVAVVDNPKLAKEWLLRSAEAGNNDAQAILADPQKIIKFGVSLDGVNTAYWTERKKVQFTSIDNNN